MAIARLNGEIIAESSDTITVEGHRYFPPQSIRAELLRPTEVRGDRHYYSVTLHGHTVADCACCVTTASIPDPRIAAHLEFLGPVEIID
ncbi:MAG TPA: DUF427 domain-containing protein [Pseudonocardiaceae bacterium]|jgi:uncharacterized protein (DUF427 family)|nr:DUF427 domain-containing protein [Pseudonocardiaceae bacterium]